VEHFIPGRLWEWGAHLAGWGLQNRFIITAEGRWDPSANTLSLKEVYTFDDGHQAFLTWKIIKRGETGYRGVKHADRWPSDVQAIWKSLPLEIYP
jgi:hypothetical protein